MKNLTPETIEKAKVAKTAEEILALAKANGVEMTAGEASTYFAQLNPKSGELDDDDLDAVAGGAGKCGDPYDQELFPEGSKVRNKTGNCPRCGKNVWTCVYKSSPGFSGFFINPTCECGYEWGSYSTKGRDMSDFYELI